MAKSNNWIIKEGYDQLGGYSSTMKISDELNPEYLEQVCNDAFKKFYLRPGYILRELKKGNLTGKAKMIISNLNSS